MKICRYRRADGSSWIGRIEGDEIVEHGADVPGGSVDLAMSRIVRDGPRMPISEANLLAPITQPPAFRDFYAFEAHVKTARAKRGLAMEPDWYELPVFYFSNPSVLHGHGNVVRYPSVSREWDYELEFAWVMGSATEIAGYTILNDCSARDIQRREMRLGLGPAKGKDFASVVGPWLVTPDEWSPGEQTMIAAVNGVEYSRGTVSDLAHTVEAMIAYACRDSAVRTGDLMGSGTVGTGCILELAPKRPWLQRGDVVELSIDGLGTLRTTVT